MIPFTMGLRARLVTGDDIEGELLGILQSALLFLSPCDDDFVMLYYLNMIFGK